MSKFLQNCILGRDYLITMSYPLIVKKLDCLQHLKTENSEIVQLERFARGHLAVFFKESDLWIRIHTQISEDSSLKKFSDDKTSMIVKFNSIQWKNERMLLIFEVEKYCFKFYFLIYSWIWIACQKITPNRKTLKKLDYKLNPI